MSLKLEDLTPEELLVYNKMKTDFLSDHSLDDSENDPEKEWKDDKFFGEQSVFNSIENARYWKTSKDGFSIYEPSEEIFKKIKRFQLPKCGKEIFSNGFLSNTKLGSMVKVRPCEDRFNNKTYLGFYIGQIPLHNSIYIKDGTFVVGEGLKNPAIFVPELGEIILGAESWWTEIKSPEDIDKIITDDDIQKIWYIQVLKSISERKAATNQDHKD